MAGAQVNGGLGVAEPAEVDDPPHAGILRGRAERGGGVGLRHGEVLGAVGGHQVGEVVDEVDVAQDGREAVGIGEVGDAQFAAHRGQLPGALRVRVAHHGSDGHAALDQSRGELPAHEAGGSDDQRPHGEASARRAQGQTIRVGSGFGLAARLDLAAQGADARGRQVQARQRAQEAVGDELVDADLRV